MIQALGPRYLDWCNDAGESGVISILIRGLPDQDVDLGDGVTLTQKKAEVHVTSSWQERTMYALGADDLQVLFYLMQFTSIYLEQMCRDNGVTLTGYVSSSETLTGFAPFRSAAVS